MLSSRNESTPAFSLAARRSDEYRDQQLELLGSYVVHPEAVHILDGRTQPNGAATLGVPASNL
jgi:hypothetical protein